MVEPRTVEAVEDAAHEVEPVVEDQLGRVQASSRAPNLGGARDRGVE